MTMIPLSYAITGDVIIQHPISRCAFHEGVSDDLMVNQVIDYYTDTLSRNIKAQDYLKNRGFSEPDSLRSFRIGFADRSLGIALSKMDRPQQESTRGALQRAGLLKDSGHELFRGSLVFPFIDQDGKIHGGYGRRITYKLKAYSAYHVHWLPEVECFFNQREVISNWRIILCKSPIEALTWWYHGFKNAVGLMGYAGFTPHHLSVLANSSVEQVFIAFGSSKAEFEAARAISHDLAGVNIESRFVFFPGGLDANGFALTSSSPEDELAELLAFALIPCSELKKQERHINE